MADSFDAFFAEAFPETNAPAGDDPPAAEETAIEAAVPDDVSLPDDAGEESEDAVDEAELIATAPDYESDDNPYRRQALELAERNRRTAEVIARAEQIRQRNERNQLYQQRVASLAEADPDQIPAHVATIIKEQAAPLIGELQRVSSDNEVLAKEIAIARISQTYGLSADESQRLAQLNDPYAMEHVASLAKQQRETASSSQSQLQAKVAELEKQLRAKNRDPRADIAGGASGGAPASKKSSSGNPMDDYWAENNMDQQFGRAS